MSDFLERISKLSPKRLALLAVELQSNLDRLKQKISEPIAIIGIGCRFPGGANDPDSFWRCLIEGCDAITEVPSERWDINALYDPDADAPGKMNTRWGGFLSGIDQFDSEFFGISPREAMGMDPQQRLLLEVAWEALEHAGQSPERLAGSRTGVFAGLCNSDYFSLRNGAPGDSIDAYMATGNAHSVATGRISYVLGLQGPSVSVDTSCSASLVAVHLACQSLKANECRMALAGGVNVILAPDTTIMLSKSRMMSPAGRCKAFDASADGFVRSEGCGLVVLKRLCDARADGDRVLAVLRGTASNQDGRSSGLTAPNGPSQVAVMRDALANAGLQPDDIDYIEAHGTGTSLGDPIESRAIAEVFASGRDQKHPLLVGSVKSNIGHAESSAGIAGLIKAVLSVQHGCIPPSLHFKNCNPKIEWNGLPIRVPTTAALWERQKGQRAAGVSSFGFSGTNAHVIVAGVSEAEPVSVDPAGAAPGTRHVLPLSARTEKALAELALRYEQMLEKNPEVELGDVCFTAGVGRSHFEHRLAVTAATRVEARELLAAFRQGKEDPRLLRGRVSGSSTPEVVFLFTGAGTMHPRTARQMFDTQPVFRRELERSDQLLRPFFERSLLEMMLTEAAPDKNGEPTVRLMDEPRYALPAIFAMECALAATWRSWGIEPGAVLGRGTGEYAAACVAGVFCIEDGLRLVAERARLATSASSAHVITAEFEQLVRHVALVEPRIAIASAATGKIAAPGLMTSSDYWLRPPHCPEYFADCIRSVQDLGLKIFLEVGPQSVVMEADKWALADESALRRIGLAGEETDRDALNQALLMLYVRGAGIDWAAVHAGGRRKRVTLPTYPFQRKRHWMETFGRQGVTTRSASGGNRSNQFQGHRLDSPAIAGTVFELEMGVNRPSFLDDHRIFGRLIMPSPAYIEMALNGAIETNRLGQAQWAPCEVSKLAILEPLILPEDGSRRIQLIFDPPADEPLAFRVCSREAAADKDEDGDVAWRTHATGRLALTLSTPPSGVNWERHLVLNRCSEVVDAAAYYDSLTGLGLEFGERFRGLTRIWRGNGEALGEVQLPAALAPESGRYRIHPALLDSCFHLLGAALPADVPRNAYLLVALDRLTIYSPLPARMWNHVVLRPVPDSNWEAFSGDILLYDDEGRAVAEIRGLQLKRATSAAMLQAAEPKGANWFYELQWREQKTTASVRSPADFIPCLEGLAKEVGPLLLSVAAEEDFGVYNELIPRLESLSGAFIVRALMRLGWSPRRGLQVSGKDLADQLSIVPMHRRLWGRLLEILAEDGFLRRDGEGWIVMRPLELTSSDLGGQARELAQQHPAGVAEVTLLSRCAERLDEVLRGTCDPLHLLFPSGDFDTADALYRRAPFARVLNAGVRQTVLAAINGAPADRTVNVLEIGAGTGGTTSFLLPSLPRERVCYTFTDLSPLFLARAREEFGEYPFVKFELLDIEKPPITQGFNEGAFDVIIAANVLHATRDLRETLSNVSQFLAPGGLLVLVEGTGRQRWVDLTFGLTEGWWRFEDTALRPGYALMSAREWQRLLDEFGFANTSLCPSANGNGLSAQQILLLSKKPADRTKTAVGGNGYWVVLDDGKGISASLIALLSERGQRCITVSQGTAYAFAPTGQAILDPFRPEDFVRLLGDARCQCSGPLRGVVNLWPVREAVIEETTPTEWESAQARLGAGVLHVTQAFLSAVPDDHASGPRLWLVTENAQAVSRKPENPPGQSEVARDSKHVSCRACQPAQALVWGLGRAISLEHPARFGAILDMDSGTSPRDCAASILSELENPSQEDAIAFRGNSRLAPRIARMENPPAAGSLNLHRDGAYLVTGGLGGLGLCIARWLAERGAGHIALLSRREFPERSLWRELSPADAHFATVQSILAIEKAGACVVVVRGDVAEPEFMRCLFSQFGTARPPLRGILHAAVDMSARPMRELDLKTFNAMCRAKSVGGWVLHKLTRQLDLDFLVFFSSTTALWGSAGLGHYAAANQALDQLSFWRREQGLPALSVNWGTWEEMRVASEADKKRVAQAGLRPMDNGRALAILERLILTNRSSAVVASVDWDALRAVYETRRPRPLFAETHGRALVERTVRGPETSSAAETEVLRQLRNAPAARRREIIIAHLRCQAADVLGFDSSRELDLDQGLFDMGMDSLMSVDLKGRLERSFGTALPSTLTFNYPSIGALTDYLLQEVLVFETSSQVKDSDGEVVDRPLEPPTDDLSEEELSRLILEKLEQKR